MIADNWRIKLWEVNLPKAPYSCLLVGRLVSVCRSVCWSVCPP